MNQNKNEIEEMFKYLNDRLDGKFPKGVSELRNYIFNTHAKLEEWMGAAITRSSFKTVESSELGVGLKSSIMGDASIQVHRLLSVMEFHATLKAFLKCVEDSKMKCQLDEKISAVNRIRNEFAHPYGNFDLKSYDIETPDGLEKQRRVLKILFLALKAMEKYLETYHKEWYINTSKSYKK